MATASASSSEAIGAAKAEASGGEWPTIDEPQPGVVLKKARKERVCTAKERISRMPPCAAGKRSSIYRGVTRHRWTGRYEAHLWDKSTWNQNQNKKGKQVYLGAYDDEEAAARAYDLAALKYWGAGTLINFPVSDYARDLEEMQMVSKEDYLVSLRRKSSAFSRGFTKFRGIQSSLDSTVGCFRALAPWFPRLAAGFPAGWPFPCFGASVPCGPLGFSRLPLRVPGWAVSREVGGAFL